MVENGSNLDIDDVGERQMHMVCEEHELWLVKNAAGNWVCPVCLVIESFYPR